MHLRHALELRPRFQPAVAALRQMEAAPATQLHGYTVFIIIVLVGHHPTSSYHIIVASSYRIVSSSYPVRRIWYHRVSYHPRIPYVIYRIIVYCIIVYGASYINVYHRAGGSPCAPTCPPLAPRTDLFSAPVPGLFCHLVVGALDSFAGDIRTYRAHAMFVIFVVVSIWPVCELVDIQRAVDADNNVTD